VSAWWLDHGLPSSCSLHDCWCEGLSSNFSLVKKDKQYIIWFLIYATFFLFAAPLNDADFFMVARAAAMSYIDYYQIPIYGLLRLVRLRLATKLRRMI
jgi:hypothetical protein